MRNTAILIILAVVSCFLIIGLQGCGAEGVPDPTTTTTTLPAPTGLVATAESLQVNLSWPTVTGAVSYNLYWSNSSTVSSSSLRALAASPKITGITTTSYTHTGLTNEAAYSYRLAAVDSASNETLLSATAVATPDTVGTLDASFNGTGYVVTNTDYDNGTDVAIDSSGRILVCGSRTSSPKAAVWRYNPDGTLDTSFASLGIWQDSAASSYANSIFIDSSGRILVVGYLNSGTQYMAIWRLLTNGSLDTSFGTGGIVTDSLTHAVSDGLGLCLDTSGNVYVAGFFQAGASDLDMAVWRYNSSGGSGAVTSFTGGPNYDYAYSIGLDYSGHLMAAGYINGSSSDKMTLLRFTPLSPFGLDYGFNTTGYTQSLAGGDISDGYHLAITQSDQYIICGMSRVGGNKDMAVWRFNSDGSLDTSFNGTGYFTQNGAAGGNGVDSAQRTILDNSGRVLVGGYSANAAGKSELVVWRLKKDGTLDPTFNSVGYTVHGNAAGSNYDDYGTGLTFDQRRRLVAVGRSTSPGGVSRMVIWRFK
jgi:uncharacterized delta-60 repeat protein